MGEVVSMPGQVVSQLQDGLEEAQSPVQGMPVVDEGPPPGAPVLPVERAVVRSGRRRGARRRGAPVLEQNDEAALSPRSGNPSPPPVTPDLRPLTGDMADEGRRVIVPRELWPDYECGESDGKGWLAEVVRARRGDVTVRFLSARNSRGVPFRNERLAASALKPV